jgi:hypothetical protein
MKYLDKFGYVVISSVASSADLVTAKDLLWNWLESLPQQGILPSITCQRQQTTSDAYTYAR